MIIVKILLLVVSVILLILGIIMLFPHRLTQKEKSRIMQSGLVHFTDSENVNEIISSSMIKSSKHTKCVYFFQNEMILTDYIQYNKLENKKVKIIIENLSKDQINKLKIRYNDMAIVFFGDFCFSEDNNICVSDSGIQSCGNTNLFFYNKCALVLLYIGLIFTVISILLIMQ